MQGLVHQGAVVGVLDLLRFLVRAKSVSSSRARGLNAARAAAVKPNRRTPPKAARSGLDGGEHGAKLPVRGEGGAAMVGRRWGGTGPYRSAAWPRHLVSGRARRPDTLILHATTKARPHERRDLSETAGASPWMRAVRRLSSFTSAGGMVRRSEARMKHGALGDDAGLQIAPQRHHQLARQSDDGDAPNPSLGVADPRLEPARERAAGLPVDPPSGEFDCGRAGAGIAGLADPLVALVLRSNTAFPSARSSRRPAGDWRSGGRTPR